MEGDAPADPRWSVLGALFGNKTPARSEKPLTTTTLGSENKTLQTRGPLIKHEIGTVLVERMDVKDV